MTVYSPAQVYNTIAEVYKQESGGKTIPVNSAIAATAIVLKESGGNSQAVNTNTDGSIDRGWWQWNSKAWPDITPAIAFNPEKATRIAYRVTGGFQLDAFQPWIRSSNTGKTLRDEFYRTQNIQQSMVTAANVVTGGNESQKADFYTAIGAVVNNPNRGIPFSDIIDTVLPGDPASDFIGTSGDIVGGVGGGLEAIGSFFATLMNPELWKRVGVAALGVGVLIVAVTFVAGPTVADITPIGKALK